MSDLFNLEENKENEEIKKLLGKGESLLFREEYDEAITLFELVIDEDVMNIAAHLGLLRAYSHDYEILSSPEINQCLKIINKFFPSIPDERYRDFLDRKKNRTQREQLFLEAQGILKRKKNKQQEMIAPYQKELANIEKELNNFRNIVKTTIEVENQRIEEERKLAEEKKDMQEMKDLQKYLMGKKYEGIDDPDLLQRLQYFKEKYPVYGITNLNIGLYMLYNGRINTAFDYFRKGYYNNIIPEPLCLSYTAYCRFYLNIGCRKDDYKYEWADQAIKEIDIAAQNGVYEHYYLGAAIYWRGYNTARSRNVYLGNRYMEKYYEVYKNELDKLVPYAIYLWYSEKRKDAIDLLFDSNTECTNPIAYYYLGRMYGSEYMKDQVNKNYYLKKSAKYGYKRALLYLDPVEAKKIEVPKKDFLDYEFVFDI